MADRQDRPLAGSDRGIFGRWLPSLSALPAIVALALLPVIASLPDAPTATASAAGSDVQDPGCGGAGGSTLPGQCAPDHDHLVDLPPAPAAERPTRTPGFHRTIVGLSFARLIPEAPQRPPTRV